MCNLICDAITCCVLSCDIGKINASDKSGLKKNKIENMEIKEFLHKPTSKTSFRHRIHSLLRRADARESADMYTVSDAYR